MTDERERDSNPATCTWGVFGPAPCRELAVWTDGRVLACDEHRQMSDKLGGSRAWRPIGAESARSGARTEVRS